MSAIFSATWQASRLCLPAWTALATIRAATVVTSSVKPPSFSTTILATTLRPLQPSILLDQRAKTLHTTTPWLAKQPPPSLQRAQPPPSQKDPTSEVEKDGDSSTPTQAELNKIFGQKIDRDGAAELLAKVQRQRREGTLDQGLPYPGQLIDRGLEYLRAKYPVDEDAAIIARVDKELDGDWSLPQTNPEKSRTGRSELQEIRRIKKAERVAEETAQEAKEKEAELKSPQKSGALTARDGSKRDREALVTSKNSSKSRDLVVSESFKKRMEQQDAWIRKSNQRVAELRAAATMKYIPQMSKWQRLWPCGVFTFSAVGLALIFAHVYTPPSQKARIFPDIPPAAAAVGTIVAINVLVFLLWKVPTCWKSLNRSFIITPAVPHAFSMLGAEFSHQQFSHLLTNMAGIWFIGTQLHDDIGRGSFLALIVCGSVLPSFCSLIPPVMMKIFITATLGASGIFTTLLGASCVLHEGRKIRFPLLPLEITSWMNTAAVLAILVSVELIQLARYGLMPKALINSGSHHIDHVGHLAGYATGIGAACFIRQTDPYWGSVQRKSFWRWKEAQSEDPAAEMLMRPETLGIKADTSKSRESAP